MKKNTPKRSALFALLIILLLSLTACAGNEGSEFLIVSGQSLSDSTAFVKKNSDVNLAELAGSVRARVYVSDGSILDASAGDVTLYGNGEVSVAGTHYSEIFGIIENPPTLTIMDVYNLSAERLSEQGRVMVIYLDGFGYTFYETALERGDIPNLAGLDVSLATSVFPTITPVNYAAMTTGEVPKVTGVMDRNTHLLSCESIFDFAESLGMLSFIAEGNTQIIDFSADQELNADLDGDGDTDNEVLECSLAAIESGESDFVFIHFHGIDDTSHATGPDSDETAAKIRETDLMIGELMAKWGGPVVIAADHGQHLVLGEHGERRGEHSTFAASDLFIPIFTNY